MNLTQDSYFEITLRWLSPNLGYQQGYLQLKFSLKKVIKKILIGGGFKFVLGLGFCHDNPALYILCRSQLTGMLDPLLAGRGHVQESYYGQYSGKQTKIPIN